MNLKAFGESFLYWVDFIRYLTYCRQANVGFCTGFFPFGKFLRGNSLIWNEFQPKYTFFFTKFQFTANISAHFAHQVNFSRFDHIYNFGGPVNKNKWLTPNRPLIQLWCARSKLKMDEICSLNIHLWYVDIAQKVLLKSLHAQKRSFLLLNFATLSIFMK